MNPRERALYFSLWGLILLGVALWRFRGAEPQRQSPESVKVEIGSGLRPWIRGGEVTELTPHSFTVQIQLRPEYRRSLNRDGIELKLGYRLHHGETDPRQGTVGFRVTPEVPTTILTVPNPTRAPASRIELFLQ